MSRALLVVDVQVGLFFHPPFPLHADSVIARINRLIARARAAAVPVIFIQHESGPEDGLQRDTPDWQLHPHLARWADDPVVAKTACDGFCTTQLKDLLTRLQVSDLVVTGYATDFCVDATVKRAASEGYAVTVVADAHSTKDRPFLTAAQIIAQHNWIWANFIAPVPLQVIPEADIVF